MYLLPSYLIFLLVLPNLLNSQPFLRIWGPQGSDFKKRTKLGSEKFGVHTNIVLFKKHYWFKRFWKPLHENVSILTWFLWGNLFWSLNFKQLNLEQTYRSWEPFYCVDVDQKMWSVLVLYYYNHAKCQAGWITSWNQDCQEKYQQLQICRWHNPMAESKEELKSLFMKVKEESEKAGLKFNIQKTKIMASGPIT